MRALLVLAIVLLLHLWVLQRASSELAYELPPPAPSTVQAELFKLPAKIAVGSSITPPPQKRVNPPRAITPPVSDTTGAAKPEAPVASPVTVEASPSPTSPAGQPDAADSGELLPPGPANALPQDVVSPLDAVVVSFPKVGRFVSDTSYAKGMLRVLGTTTIEWKIGPDAYEARSVTADDTGRALLTLTSQGGVRSNVGVAPVHYTEQRLSRSPVAVNFQWEPRKVTFSATTAEFPLNDGVQDQLSFMAQLALLAQAFPDRFRPGESLALEVAGTRNIRVYDLRIVGWEALRTGTGVVDALKLDRVLPPDVKDARIELWLAPSLRWLPVRTRTTLPGDDVVETLLREVTFEE